MPKFQVTSPDGKTWEIEAPDGATEAQALEYAKGQWSANVQTPPELPASVKTGSMLRAIPRQLGLAARYAIEGPAQAAQLFTEPLRKMVVEPVAGLFHRPDLNDLVLGTAATPKGKPLGAAASDLADSIGLPRPEGADERVIGDAARMVAGVGGLSTAGSIASRSPGVVGKVGELFAANPGRQALAVASGGLAGGMVREAGGGPWSQAGAALAAGVAAPVALGRVENLANATRRIAAERLAAPVVQRQVEQRIQLVMQRSGIDWANVPERIRQQMRQEITRAMRAGEDLSPDAIRRLLDFQRVGATPTRGMLTQDPGQITREQNLSRVAANSADLGLQRLPQLQNQNTATLLRNIDDLGAQQAPDAYATGQRVIGALDRNISASRSRINSLYSRARDTQGRSAPLDGAAFTARANQLLDEALVGGKLPSDVAGHMNRIARGEVPFTVDYAEQLKTRIGDLQRASRDGQERLALGHVRRALDETPLISPQGVNPGMLPATAGTVPPSQVGLGHESINAFSRARRANRAFMQRVERTPALQAVMDGVEPDRFVGRFITGPGATVADVTALRRAVANDPDALRAIKANIAEHLRSAATNATGDVVKFSAAAYSRALNNIGDRKLSLFFEPQEVEQLRAVGRVGTLMTAQPAGSAVNTSNSGALVMGRGLDWLDRVVGRAPLGLNTMVQGVIRGTQQQRALDVPRSLLAPAPSAGLLKQLAVPAVYTGLLASSPNPGLLAPPPVEHP